MSLHMPGVGECTTCSRDRKQVDASAMKKIHSLLAARCTSLLPSHGRPCCLQNERSSVHCRDAWKLASVCSAGRAVSLSCKDCNDSHALFYHMAGRAQKANNGAHHRIACPRTSSLGMLAGKFRRLHLKGCISCPGVSRSNTPLRAQGVARQPSQRQGCCQPVLVQQPLPPSTRSVCLHAILRAVSAPLGAPQRQLS